MSHGVRGRALVINVFNTREGSDLDHINVSRMLNDMGFIVAEGTKPKSSFSAQVRRFRRTKKYTDTVK